MTLARTGATCTVEIHAEYAIRWKTKQAGSREQEAVSSPQALAGLRH